MTSTHALDFGTKPFSSSSFLIFGHYLRSLLSEIGIHNCSILFALLSLFHVHARTLLQYRKRATRHRWKKGLKLPSMTFSLHGRCPFLFMTPSPALSHQTNRKYQPESLLFAVISLSLYLSLFAFTRRNFTIVAHFYLSVCLCAFDIWFLVRLGPSDAIDWFRNEFLGSAESAWNENCARLLRQCLARSSPPLSRDALLLHFWHGRWAKGEQR